MSCGLILNNVDVLWRLQLENGELLSNTCLYENTTVENPSEYSLLLILLIITYIRHIYLLTFFNNCLKLSVKINLLLKLLLFAQHQ